MKNEKSPRTLERKRERVRERERGGYLIMSVRETKAMAKIKKE